MTEPSNDPIVPSIDSKEPATVHGEPSNVQAEPAIAEPHPSNERTFRNSAKDWGVRGFIAVLFLFFSANKFTSRHDAPWVLFFNQVGTGQWLRYLTGVLELIGAFLVLMERTVTAGLVLLGCMMAGAILIEIAVLRRPADAFIPFSFLCAMVAFWMHRNRA